jgi:LCP family protein required for cell wall assembly
MRIPQWFVLVWVVVFAALSVGGSVVVYGFTRDRAIELDTLLDLPAKPPVGDLFDLAKDLLNPPDKKETVTTVPTGTDDIALNVPPTYAPTVTTVATESSPVVTDEVPVDATPVTPEPETPAASAEIPYWQDPRRVTVLLMGIDQRQGEEGTFPTDTMILFSVDPVGHTAAILSIPRDLWVDYPGMNQSGRINGANILGDQVAFPGGGGPALAMRTVESMLGVPVNYYVLINFEVFTTLIDVIGPVEVCPSEPIDDDKYPDGSYGFITIHFDAGCQELNSERLLQYARTRHGDSDISRGTRQQEVIMAVRQKVLTTGGIMALVPEAQSLWDSLQNNFRTNMSFNDMLSLARTAESVPDGNIRQDQISFEDVSMSTTPEGDSILVPYSSDILSIVQDLFRPPDGQ